MDFTKIISISIIGLVFFCIYLLCKELDGLNKENEELREQLGQEESGEDSDNDVFFNDFRKND